MVEIELVPSTCWFSNVRSNVRPATWGRIRADVAGRSNWLCSICRRAGARHAVECHEVWSYNETARVQVLSDLAALCPDCHLVKHFGYALSQGRGRQALAWLCELNDWTPAMATAHVQAAMAVQHHRSQFHWTLDLSLLQRRYGIRLNRLQKEV